MSPGAIAVGTIAAKPLLPSARVVARSLAEHHADWPAYLLLADEVDGVFAPSAEPFEVLGLDDLGLDRAEIRLRAFRYEQQQFSYAMTAALMLALLDRGHERVVFLKQESLVVGPLDGVVRQLDDDPIVLTPHLLAPLDGDDAADRERTILQSGVCNGGIVAVRESPTARAFLGWWADRLRTDCRHDLAAGIHFEQRWLDLAPSLFGGVGFVRDQGVNIGHWNLLERTLTGASLVRFSGFDAHEPDVITRYNRRLELGQVGEAAALFRIYRDRLHDEGYDEARHWPYAYGSFDNGVPIPIVARQLHARLGDAASQFGDPFAAFGEHSFYSWLREGALWSFIHRGRPDLQHAFPDPDDRDRDSFRQWARAFGAAEHGIAPALVP